jgi:hypothetical protein
VHSKVIIEFGVDAAVCLEEVFLDAFAVFLPVVLFQRDNIKIREIGVRSVIGRNFGDVHGAPGGDNLGN